MLGVKACEHCRGEGHVDGEICLASPTLFAYDSKGKVRFWSVRIDKPDEGSEFYKVQVIHGLEQGKKTEAKPILAKPKNIGKSNETTSLQQAVLEAASRFNKQVDREDYHWCLELSGKQIRPMLALDATKVPHRINWRDGGIVAQPKLDGLRLTVGKRYLDQAGFEFMTRKGETYDVPHLKEECQRLISTIQDLGHNILALDGELYKHGMPLNRITSLAKKLQEDTKHLEFCIFDLVIAEMTFLERFTLLRQAFDSIYSGGQPVGKLSIVKTVPARSIECIKAYNNVFSSAGYEGVIVRDTASKYETGRRSAGLFKYKEFDDAEFKIVNILEDRVGNSKFVCEIPEGKYSTDRCPEGTFEATPKRTDEEKVEILKNKDEYVGKWLTVKFQGYSEYGVPLFPVGLEIRDCDQNGNPLS